MSSYNTITKFQYKGGASDLVTLREYIIFQDDKSRRKYIVFKFTNNVTQQLLGMKFEVCQYNVDDTLIEKSIVVYNKYLASAEEDFVPKAKLRVSYECTSISIRLMQAVFDRFMWNEGEFVDNKFKFDHFYSDEQEEEHRGESSNAKKRKDEKEAAPARRVKGRKAKKDFKLKDATKKNFSKLPLVFNAIVFIVIFAFVAASLIIYKGNSAKFTSGDFRLRDVSAKDSKEVMIYGYTGDDDVLKIPAEIDDYKVVGIDGGAFKGESFKEVEYLGTGRFTVASDAFTDCVLLQKFTTQANVLLGNGAFNGCTDLYSVTGGAGSDISDGCFIGCPKM